MTENESIIIVGGGLSGLTLAYLLAKENIKTTILEGDSRLGGRIHTIQGNNDTPLELGATWFSDIHPTLLSLINELELTKYPQYATGKSLFQTKTFEPPQEFHVPESESPSYRLKGGTQQLIQALKETLDPSTIRLNEKVVSITNSEKGINVSTTLNSYSADKVILCLPPQLAGECIQFSPPLPQETTLLLPSVHTWMFGSVKFVIEYSTPFWRKNGYSGMLYSHSGIISEMYDHTNYEKSRFGFTGFLNGSASSYSQQTRKELVLKQLQELLGKETSTPLLYRDKVWVNEFVGQEFSNIQRPHQNNGHPLLQQSYMDNKLFFSGTESALTSPGYMEGAIISAQQTLAKLK